MLNYNKVILMGHLTDDPKHTVFENGKQVANFSIATNRKWKNDNGEVREEACFVDCKVFGTKAKTIADNCHKGRPLFIDGHLYLEKWNDKKTGEPRSKIRVVVDSFEFVDKKEGSSCDSNCDSSCDSSCDSHVMAGSDDFDAIVNAPATAPASVTEDSK